MVATELIDLGGDFAEPFGVNLGVQDTSMLRSGLAAVGKGERGLSGRAKSVSSEVVPDLAQGDAVDPGPELLILSQTVKLCENRQQRFLHDILGCVGVLVLVGPLLQERQGAEKENKGYIGIICVTYGRPPAFIRMRAVLWLVRTTNA